MTGSRTKILVLAILFTVLCGSLSWAQDNGTPAGSILQIQAIGLYKDDFDREHRTVSENISITIQTVSQLFVTPNETEPSLQIQSHQEFTRAFQVCNGGNDAEKVVVSKLDVPSPARLINLYFDSDGSGTVTPSDQAIQVGETLSPSMEPAGCVGVLVTVNSESYPSPTDLPIRLTARTTATAANGIQEATGQIVTAVIGGARITGPSGAAPSLLVNTVPETVATANQVLTFSLALRNSGDITAEGIVFVHDLTDGLDYLAGSLKLNSTTSPGTHAIAQATSSTSHVEFGIPSLAPGESAQLDYQVRVKPGVAGRGLVNHGEISGHNFASSRTTETVILIDPFGVVFAARGGLAQPIAGANVALIADTSANSPVSIPPGSGFPPNTENRNPDIADANGRYNFRLTPEQLRAASAEATYYLKASAPGFMTRMLKVSVAPTHSGLFQATFTAIDGHAIAAADGLSLVRDPVTLEDLGSLSPNIPMFETHSLEIDKSVDRQRAEIGDVLTYTINIHNPTAATVSDLVLRDTLPQSFIYAAGTATMQTANATASAAPSKVNGDLILKLGEIAAAGRIQIKYRVRVGANAREGDQFNQAIATGKFANGDPVRTDAARVSVRVGAGVFSTRQIILGRVFEDTNRNRYFDHDDKPIAGARVYLMNGQYVLTDAAGLYNFPNVADGAAVIALDPISLPAGLKLEDDGQVSGKSWTRLLRTPLGGGALFHQDFALARKATIATSPKSPASSIENGNHILVKTAGAPSLPVKPLGAGTYEIASTEKIAPVKPGEALIVSPALPAAAVTSGSPITVRVAIDWTVLLEINGKPISDKNIGETRVDRANQITTYTFAGLTVPPGPNEIRVTPIGPKDERGVPLAFKVMGRGPARRIELLPNGKSSHPVGKSHCRRRFALSISGATRPSTAWWQSRLRISR